jgi:hypothetical protein
MAIVPSSGTNVRFLSGIKFNNDYKHTRWFDTLSDQLNWWANQTTVYAYNEFNIQRVEDKTFIRFNVDISQLWGVNYVVFYNEFHGRQFYAFINKIEYVQKNRTDVHIELDVIQTFMFDIQWQPSFVVREHCQLWNADGSPVINTVPEDLNYGSEYNIAKVQNFRPYNDLFFMVVVAKKTMHTGDWSNISDANGWAYSINGLPQALNYYIMPFKLDGSTPACSLGSLDPFVGDFLVQCYKSTQAVNNIVSIYITDMLPDQPSYDGNTISFNPNYYQMQNIGSSPCIYVHNIFYDTGAYDAGLKYDGFSSVTESKLLMYPYTVTLLDDFKGNRVELKNEYINNTHLVVDMKSSLGVSNKVVYTVKDYLTSLMTDDTLKDMVTMEKALIDSNPNDLPVLVDNLSAFIQGNRNSIQNQANSIMFNGGMNAFNHVLSTPMMGMTGPIGLAQGVGSTIQGAGNSILQMQAMNAKQQDIGNTPPSIAKMGGNSYFDYGNGYTGIWIIKKEITPEYRKKLSDFFNMFGYKKNEVKFPNIHTRQYWNFIQTKSCIIQGNFNNEDLEDIKSVFDSGITLWHTDDIGNYTLTNEVIANG